MKNLLMILLLIKSLAAYGQTFIEDVQVGQKMPAEIRNGGFTEGDPKNCSCRIFNIKYSGGYDPTATAPIGQTIAIHYNQEKIVTGVIKITLKPNVLSASQTYLSQISEFLRNMKNYPDRKIIAARDYNPKGHIVDGIYYFAYLYNDKYRKVVGFIKAANIEETYIPNSSYKPRLTQ